MAGADYFRCDVCDGKAFYDANLNWNYDEQMPGRPELPALGYVGTMIVICNECYPKHKAVIVESDGDGGGNE